MKSTNEWEQLKTVIVGIANNAKIPDIDLSLRTVNYADKKDINDVKTGTYPQTVIDEANEDLDTFCSFLASEGVKVLRPRVTDCSYYNYCPRDSVFIHDSFTFPTPMPIRTRKNEWRAFEEHLSDVFLYDYSHSDKLYNLNCIGDPNTLALTEHKPAFDAANILRANNDLLYLVSNSGNKKGANLLQNFLGDCVKVHLLEGVYSYMHIDSTVAFLREGLLLANPSRVKSKDDLPKPFCNWDIIYCPDPVDIGYYSNYCNASNWINMNLFSINENLVCLEEHQIPLAQKLSKHGIESKMLPMRHQRTLGGGFHCVTLDIERNNNG